MKFLSSNIFTGISKLIINAILISVLFSCGTKPPPPKTLSNTNGYKVTNYSQYSVNSWIPVSGSSIYKFSKDTGGVLNITYNNYSDVYGNCTGNVTSTLSQSDQGSLIGATPAAAGPYDVFTPYLSSSTTVTLNSPDIITSNVYVSAVSKITLTGCPFPNYSTNYYIVTLYKSGTVIITDWNRSKDYSLTPID